MANASTSTDPNKMELTPMRVSWAGQDLGGTMKNAVIDIKIKKHNIVADQYGATNLDMRLNGTEITVTTELSQVRDSNTWAEAFPSAIQTGSGVTGSILFQLPIGRSDLLAANLLTLHPIDRPDADTTQDHNFYLAHPAEATPITYGPGEQSALKVVWNVFPVLTGSGAPKFYKFGSLSVGP